MTSKAVSVSRYFAQASAVLVVALGASACSSVPDWVDPTSWVGGSDEQASGLPADNDSGTQIADNPSANAQTPDLAAIPDRPTTASSSDDQKDVSQTLAADRSRAQYSGDALRAGTEPAAAPPPAAAPQTEDLASNDSGPAPAPAAPPPPQVHSAPGTLPSDDVAPAPPPTRVAEATPLPAVAPAPSAPAVPAVSSVSSVPSSDAALGFRPSSAPALDGSVAQFVPPSILSRYRQTAAIGPQPAVPMGTEDPALAVNTTTSHRRRSRSSTVAMGGPEQMSGAVVANFDALQAGSAMAPIATEGGPAAVVFFRGDTTILNAEGKEQVRAAARAFLARGGQGYVRIIGHSSVGASRMSAQRQLVWNFEHSEARAKAVARALISEGVPAEKVLVNAATDDGSAPGEDGNRRAEIFFQS